ncbi:MAG: hypothetical protein Q4D59_07895, partial [Erysipelotrichaceae bacterium]|nr:hypothetical protein [Erysipelotrichaceae bacterium]
MPRKMFSFYFPLQCPDHFLYANLLPVSVWRPDPAQRLSEGTALVQVQVPPTVKAQCLAPGLVPVRVPASE